MSCLDTKTFEIPAVAAPTAEQPPVVEFTTTDGVFIKQMYLKHAGSVVPQHSHEFDHTTALLRGVARIWADDDLLGTFIAPDMVFIKAGVKHTIVSMEPDTLLYCIHKLRDGEVKIKEEHHLEFVGN